MSQVLDVPGCWMSECWVSRCWMSQCWMSLSHPQWAPTPTYPKNTPVHVSVEAVVVRNQFVAPLLLFPPEQNWMIFFSVMYIICTLNNSIWIKFVSYSFLLFFAFNLFITIWIQTQYIVLLNQVIIDLLMKRCWSPRWLGWAPGWEWKL